MERTRRMAVGVLIGSATLAKQFPDTPDHENKKREPFPDPNEDAKLPNGKSQKDAIAEREHAQALKDSSHMVELAQQIREELEKAGNFVVPLSTVKKTEEIERLAKRIRGRLKQ